MIDPVELLQRLVRTPSVNPTFSGDVSVKGEGELARLIAGELEGWGFKVELPDVFPGRPNLVAFREGSTAEAIGLCAHLDTMSPDGMTVPAFDAAVRDGCVWGRGSADTKASIAAMLTAVRAELDENDRRVPSLLILLTCDEEAHFTGAQQFAEAEHPKLAGMVIGEPTGLTLIGAHKGVLRTTIRTSGVAAHGSMPERGVNAIYRMAEVVQRLERLAGELGKRPVHPRLGHGTLNVGTIAGGTAVNTVPDSCEIKIDRRVLPGEDAAAIVAELQAAVAGIKGVTIDKPYVNVPGFAIDVNHPWARRISGALKQPADGVAPYATDASVLHHAGMPCLVYGPAAPGAAHSADEHVAVDEVLRAVEGYRAIIGTMNDER